MSLALDDTDFEIDTSEQPPFAQTPSLGLKQSVVRWLPMDLGTGATIAVSGSWDEETNELAAWRVQVDSDAEVSAMRDDDGAVPAISVHKNGAAMHDGCVLDLITVSDTSGASATAYTASGAGGVRCHSVRLDEEGTVAFVPQWGESSATGLATLGVSWSSDAKRIGTVGEDGAVVLLHPESGRTEWRAQSNEPALFDVCWWDANTVVTAGTSIALWDVRTRATAPHRELVTSPAAHAHLSSQLLCVAVEAHPPHRVVAGASDGAIYLWDARAAQTASAGMNGGRSANTSHVQPLHTISEAHQADVWDVQLASSTHGELLSCSSDGTLAVWQLEDSSVRAHGVEPARRTLVQLSLPINSLELSLSNGMLASASDAQVLTFLDMRS